MIDILQIRVIGRANIKAPSFKNLPEELSIPTALFMPPFSEDLRYIWSELFEKLFF